MLKSFIKKGLVVAGLAAVFLVALAVPAFAQDENFGEIAPVIAWLVGAVVAFGPGARGITWIVDRVRDAVSADLPTIVWPLLAFVIALGACLAFGINVVGGLFTQLPKFAESTALDGTAGEVLTAVALAGFSSSWHDRDAARARSNAGSGS